jgi:hypothetical protein
MRPFTYKLLICLALVLCGVEAQALVPAASQALYLDR